MTLERLQHAGLKPSRLAMGCEPLGGTDWGDVNIPQARQAVQRALDLGVTVFDTADVYGLGQSEIELSRALGKNRHRAFIITKFGVRWKEKKTGRRAETYKDSSPAYIKIALEGSLRRLKVEAIPLYLVHWPDNDTKLDDTLSVLESLRQQGLILNYGLSNFKEKEILNFAKSFLVRAVEGPFNLIDSKKGKTMFNVANDSGMARFAYGVLAQGLLSGKYSINDGFASKDRRSRLTHFTKTQWHRNRVIFNVLKEMSKKYQKPYAEIAIRWVLDSNYVDCAIVGAKTPSQVESNVLALHWKLEKEDLHALNLANSAIENKQIY